MADLYVSWDDYYKIVEDLAAKIYQSKWSFDQILCLAKGGLRVGDTLARIFDVPLAILSVSSYGGENNQIRGDLNIARTLTMTTPTLGAHLLIVDDLVDSGITLAASLKWLHQHHSFDVQAYRTAVLWWKACSEIEPTYYGRYLEDSPWIHQPFEKYERMSPSAFVNH